MTLQSFDEVEQYVAAENAAAAATVGAPQDLCSAWRKARPVVLFVLNLPLIPSRWKAIIQPVLTALDTFCP